MNANQEHSCVSRCVESGLPICRRMLNINLALGYSEDFFSLKNLSNKHSMSPDEMFEFALDYVKARECFRKEWAKMQSREECPLPHDCAIDLCFYEKNL